MKRVLAWSTEHKLLALILAVSFVLSYRAWWAVAESAGMGVLSAGLPLLVDLFALLAARSIHRLSGFRWAYAWCLLLLMGGTSIWGNAIHAHPMPIGALTLTQAQAMVVASIPAVVMIFGIHLTQMVADADVKAAIRAAKVAERRSPARVSPAAGTTGAVTSPPSRRIGPTTRMPQARSAGTRSPRRDEAWAWLEEHHGARAVDLQQALGVTQSTASRWVRDWKASQGPRLERVS